MNTNKIKKILENQFAGLPVPFLVGEPGTGKSQFFRDLAEKNNWEFYIVPSQSPAEDFVGIPSIEAEGFVYKPSELIQKMISCERKTLFLFDELNMAHPKAMVALYVLFNERKWNNIKISDNAMLAGTGNYGETDGCEAVVEEMPAALRERLLIMPFETKFDGWKKWAMENLNISMAHPVLEFLEMEPRYFQNGLLRDEFGAPSPRSWTHVIKIFNLLDNEGIDFDILKGILGAKTAMAFVEFLKENNSITWERVKKDPELIKKLNPDNSSKFVNSLLSSLDNSTKLLIKDAKLIVESMEYLPDDACGAIIEKLSNLDPKVQTKIKKAAQRVNNGNNKFKRLLSEIIKNILN